MTATPSREHTGQQEATGPTAWEAQEAADAACWRAA